MKRHWRLSLLLLIIIPGLLFSVPGAGYAQSGAPKDGVIQSTASPSTPAADEGEEADSGEELKNTEAPSPQQEDIRVEDKKEEETGDTEAEGDEDEDEYLEEEEMETIADPLKPFNKAMFEFNDKLYFYLLKPVSQAWEYVLPEQVRLSIRNAISNITTPVRLLNCILQGEAEKAAIEFSRFMVNTTAGVLGFFDVAKKYHNLEKQDEDFGQTLGFYGLKEGFYIVWPFFGPSTARDTLGMLGDYFSDPFIYVNPTTDVGVAKINTTIHSGITTTNRVNETSLTLGTYEEFKESSIDPYVAMRSAYFELRRNKIKK